MRRRRRASGATPDPSGRSIEALQKLVADFNAAREWRQFHAPKNLVMALGIEAAEMMEPFRWLGLEESWTAARQEPTASYLRDEMADVLLLLLSLSDYLDVDLLDAAYAKLQRNAERYPVERARGRSDKYTAYQQTAATTSAATEVAERDAENTTRRVRRGRRRVALR